MAVQTEKPVICGFWEKMATEGKHMKKNARRKLPIGIQSFADLRKNDYIYIDKTAYVYELVHSGKPYFLSRPRRFGKSLFLSTLRAYFEGKKELFAGLSIEEMEQNNPDAWQEYPVFYFDFNKDNFMRHDALEDVLSNHLNEWENQYRLEQKELSLSARFQNLLVKANEITGKQAVVLVDEYDKPLLETMTEKSLEEHNRAVFKGFFSTLKSYDEYLKFVFLTGVTKFSKVSIFSDLNQLRDISLNREYAKICGITEAEMQAALMPEIEALAAQWNMTTTECFKRLKQNYDGYHFYPDSEGMYNPFSVLNALDKKEFGAYWFATGTPTFLIQRLEQTGYDAKLFTNGKLFADEAMLSDYRTDNPNPIPLFYQTGYLTIVDYDRRRMRYTLGYPNEEVKYGFMNSIAPYYLHEENRDSERTGTDIFAIDDAIEEGDTDRLCDILTALFARLPYNTNETYVERDFQNVIYIVFMLLGKYVKTEIHSAKGRADCIVETEDYVYIFEFKRDGTADAALAQIEEKGYAIPYRADRRTVYKIGANFDSTERTLSEWKVVSGSM